MTAQENVVKRDSLVGGNVIQTEFVTDTATHQQANNIYEQIAAQRDHYTMKSKNTIGCDEQSHHHRHDDSQHSNYPQFNSNQFKETAGTVPFVGYQDEEVPHFSERDAAKSNNFKRETYVGADPILFESSIDGTRHDNSNAFDDNNSEAAYR